MMVSMDSPFKVLSKRVKRYDLNRGLLRLWEAPKLKNDVNKHKKITEKYFHL